MQDCVFIKLEESKENTDNYIKLINATLKQFTFIKVKTADQNDIYYERKV